MNYLYTISFILSLLKRFAFRNKRFEAILNFALCTYVTYIKYYVLKIVFTKNQFRYRYHINKKLIHDNQNIGKRDLSNRIIIM